VKTNLLAISYLESIPLEFSFRVYKAVGKTPDSRFYQFTGSITKYGKIKAIFQRNWKTLCINWRKSGG